MSDNKNAIENLLDAAKAKIDEGADRLRAAGHDLASRVKDSPIESAVDKLKEGQDRLRAEVNNAEAKTSFEKAKEQISETLNKDVKDL